MEDRLELDKAVDLLADKIVSQVTSSVAKSDLSEAYIKNIVKVCKAIQDIEIYKMDNYQMEDPANKLGKEILNEGKKYDYKEAWLGELNYSITRLVQVVPKKMVESGHWQNEFRYWIAALTMGSLEQAKLEVAKITSPDRHKWIVDGFVGTMACVSSEYYRRAVAPYESVQIVKNGDAFTTPHRSDPIEHINARDNSSGFIEMHRESKPEKNRVV